MIYSQISVGSLFTGCRCPFPREFYSRVPLTLSVPSKDDLLDEVWPRFKVRRESGSGNLLLPRWSMGGGASADRNVILGQGRLSGLVSSWEWNFPWQHVVPFATGIHCCESSLLPCHEPWTRGYDLDNGMGLDFNGFRKPWQYHMKQWSMHVYRN